MKNKKTRDTSFSKSWKLIDAHGLEAIRELWEEHGIYGAARRLNNASPYVIRYIVHKNEWTRDASKVPHLVKAVINGRAKTSDYKTLDFTDVQINFNSKTGETMTKYNSTEFLTFIRTFKGSYTDFKNIRQWIESTRRLKKCATVDELKKGMEKDSYFTKRHFTKLDAAEKFYFANKDLFVPKNQ